MTYVPRQVMPFLCLVMPSLIAAPATQVGVLTRIAGVIAKQCPDAQVTRDNAKLVAKYGTMTFTVHRRLRTGEILPKTGQVEGPNFRGFILEVSLARGGYEGPLEIPQTLKRPYWLTYIDRPPTQDGTGHYVINFSYGLQMDRELMKAILDVLPKARTPAAGANRR